jgi:hypothetical protein
LFSCSADIGNELICELKSADVEAEIVGKVLPLQGKYVIVE